MSKFWRKRFTSKYTGKQIDDAVAKAGTALQNPMTAAGDLIVGGEDGAADKLAKGTDGKVLKMVSGAPAWADDEGGMENPMTAAGDMIIGGADGAAERLGKGTDGQVLSMVSGAPAWAAAQGGGHAYWHTLKISVYSTSSQDLGGMWFFVVVNNSSTALTLADFISLVQNNSSAAYVVTQGYFSTYSSGEVKYIPLYASASMDPLVVDLNYFKPTAGAIDTYPLFEGKVSSFTDYVSQIS